MNSRQFRSWLAKQGCTFEVKRSGTGHLVVRRGDAKSELPMQQAARHRLDQQDQEGPGPEIGFAMLAYPLVLEPDDNGTLLVTFADVPEAVTFGEDEPDARRRALEALETMLAARIADQQDVPLPSPAGDRPCAVLSGLVTAKVLLYRAMREAGVSSRDLARRLGWQNSQIERLLDLNHGSQLAQIEAALAALGKRLDVRMSDAA